MKRSIFVSGLMLGFAQTALAADLDYLRGSDVFAPAPAAYANWSGFYVGGQGGFSHAAVTFGTGATTILNDLVSASLPGAPQLAQIPPRFFRDTDSGGTFGAFAGYNSQWEQVILGVEVNYNHAALNVVSSVTVPVVPPNGGAGTAISAIHLNDYATFRGRAGYVMGRFLPYVMLGFALGRADFTDSARLRYTPVILGVPQPTVDISATGTQNSTIGLGYSAGLGLDVMLTDCIFLRGEYEFIQFTSFGQTPVLFRGSEPLDHKVTLNSVRGALGYRF
jgi:opacity protein-like surface antigen